MSRWLVGAVRPTFMKPGRPGPQRRRGADLAALGVVGVVGIGALASLAGCGSDSPPSCATVDAACTPRYQPTFANVYTNTLKDSCGSQSVACHSAAGRKGGLSMETAEVAFAQLTAAGLGRVVAGDAACSELTVRLHGDGEGYLMPPGAPLPAADRCAIEQWISAGASFSP